MMATTHALFGAALAICTVFIAPEYTPVALAASVAGGVFPDLDLYAEHRKTLHFPVYYTLLAIGALIVALAAPGTVTVAAAFFLLAAALHSVSDAFGGGLELRPWRGVSERAVYDHFRDTWISPRRWVRYDGSPEDLFLAAVLAVPSLAIYDGTARTVVLGLLVVSGIYTVLRKPMVSAAEWLVGHVPDEFQRHIPERFLEDLQ